LVKSLPDVFLEHPPLWKTIEFVYNFF
jgi:hypothetical protein